MKPQAILCTCHGLPEPAFERACTAGAHNVKTCFQHLGCLPQCGDCAPKVRKVLGDHIARQSNGAAGAAPLPTKPS
ncbi:hypothetical protein [Acidovorax sp.]|jgi:bacterioferritin-associated ferredoxin|uniref:(2Fe-2S)-binding protein n=1 Tax=Acidovorax sp. TaxID=1872122 RepID=UPI002ACE3E63|nr:hypothetical protein [Acidovorax sp.]